MVRKKLAMAIATIGALQANGVSALGMGDFSLNSALNQPLDAEIRLHNTLDLDKTQVLIKLADSQDFSNAGVNRDFFLTNLKFNVELDGNGNGIIKITTREPVIEPYLNFLVEAHWPSGRLLREYTVLLDLPVFSEAQSRPLTTPNNAQTPASPVPKAFRNSPSRTVSKPSAAAQTPRQTSTQNKQTAGEKYRVKHDDTLWEIAVNSRPAQNVSVQQTMVGIQELNPNAFINGNINRLKAGSVLRLPREDQIAISDQQAVGEVANQNKSWRQGGDNSSSEAQLDATPTAITNGDDSANQPRLSISGNNNAQEDSVGDGLGSDSSGAKSLLNELDQTAENLEKSELEKNELTNRLDNMEDKLATLQRLLELKDDQLAALQAAAEETTESAELQQEQSEVATSDAQLSGSEANSVDTEETVELEVAIEAEPAPKPVVSEKDSNLLDELLDSPLYTGGAGLLIIAIAAFLIMRRRKDEEAENEAEPFELRIDEDLEEGLSSSDFNEAGDLPGKEIDSTDQLVAELEEQIAADNEEEAARQQELDDSELELNTSGVAAIINQPIIDEPDDVQPKAVEAETGDAIAEADIYVAYGRYQQAIDLLRTAISKEPERADIQVKLLEVYIETRDKPGFQQQYVELQKLNDEAATVQAKEMLSSVDGVSDWLDDLPGMLTDFNDEDMDADLIEGADDSALLESDDIDLSLDDAELDIDLDLSDLDLDLESVSESELLSLDELELDLDGELNPEPESDDSNNIAGDKTVQYNVADLQAQLESSKSGSDEEISLDDESFDLDLADDLDLESLGESDLEELEAEFGDLDVTSAQPAIDNALELDDLNAELELSSATADEKWDIDLSEASEDDSSNDDEKTIEYSLDDVTQELSSSDDTATATFSAVDDATDDFDFLADTDEIATKLDLARAYIDMGDSEGARDILDEVTQDGSDEQKQDATSLLEKID